MRLAHCGCCLMRLLLLGIMLGIIVAVTLYVYPVVLDSLKEARSQRTGRQSGSR